jgi:hypothetical protein
LASFAVAFGEGAKLELGTENDGLFLSAVFSVENADETFTPVAA